MSGSADRFSEFYCVIRYDAEFERILELNAGETLIGRSQSCEIWLIDALVSREHAVLSWSPERMTIRDLTSRNGTFVNGNRINQEVSIIEGAEIQIGRYLLHPFFRFGHAIQHCFGVDESTQSNPLHAAPKRQGREVLEGLTPAQLRVYEGFVDGLSEKEIAIRLGISIHTVHTHAKAIYKSLSVSSRGELLKFSALQGRTATE